MDGLLPERVPEIARAKKSSWNPEIDTVGVDVGGTFTDFVFVGKDGSVFVRKHATTPQDPSAGVVAGLLAARGAAEGSESLGFAVCHGTTVATNALLERRGVNSALITTRGFGDVLEIGRQARQALYALDPDRPAPLLSAGSRLEVAERVDWQGQVVTPLDEAELARVLEALAREGIESIAICFLFAHLNAVHERRAAETARKFGLFVSLSADIAPEPREFERASTVAANAYVAPILDRYLLRLEKAVRLHGAASLRVMQSNGGTLSAGEAGRYAIKTALSGPAGGVIAAARIAADAGLPRLLTFDMGGTSTDVSLIVDGQCPVVTLSTLGDIPLRTPMLDIHTVGAGGGSQAWIDSGGALRVGPRSAGADPGPVAYGVSDILTVTDANLLLGRLPADCLLADRIELDIARVRACFADLASRIGRSPEAAALGIAAIAEASMVRALRHISVERGNDPADFVLLSFGGAGGLHACELADALGITEVLIPRFPGALSALGLAIAPVQHELVRAFPAACVSKSAAMVPGASPWLNICSRAVSLEAEADERKIAPEFTGMTFHGEFLLDMRYVGQSFELRVPFSPAEPAEAVAAFHAMHRARYGHANCDDPVEAVVLRYILTGAAPLPALRFPVASTAGKPSGESRVHDGHAWIAANRYNRNELAVGQLLQGPALVLQSDAATYLPPQWKGCVDAHGSLRLTPR